MLEYTRRARKEQNDELQECSCPAKESCSSNRVAGGSSDDVTINYGPGYQASNCNNITIQSTTGPTTIVLSPEMNGIDSTESYVVNSQPLHTHPPEDIALGVGDQPVQPRNIQFPSTNFCGKPRSFSPNWYTEYSWLEYSVSTDAAFCYPCRLFTTGTSKAEKAFTVSGFSDWKHACGKKGVLTMHNKCAVHKNAMLAWEQSKLNASRGTSIAHLLDSSRQQLIQKNRHYLAAVSQVLLFCAHQEIALRGHNESENSANRGNFLELLQLLAKHDTVVMERLKDGPKNATYTSPEVQNTLLKIMATMVRKKICCAVQSAGSFSLLADECKDISKKEQLTVVLRYVDACSGAVCEHFLTFVEATSLCAESLSTYLLDTLRQHQIDAINLVSQGYDGASVMSGKCSGVQERIRRVAPMGVYIHCYAHNLNLALVDCVRNIPTASEFFALVQALYVFVSTTKAHAVFIQKQKEIHPIKQPLQLQRLSDTRWTAHYSAINTICRTFDTLLVTLEEIADGSDHSKAVEARGLLHQIQQFSFIVSLITFDRVLSCVNCLSEQLQDRKIDLAKAANLVSATTETLQEFRQDESWDKLYDYAKSVASHNGIAVETEKRKRKVPRRLEDVYVLDTTGSRQLPSCSQQYKRELYFPVLDSFLTELNRRFTSQNIELMRAIQATSPESDEFLNPDSLTPLIQAYGLDGDSIKMEAALARRSLKHEEISNLSDVVCKLYPLRNAFSNLFRLVCIALTIAVSTAECERSFSALKRIKTYLRSTMTNQRLCDLAVLSIEKEISKDLLLEDVVDQFAIMDRNRRIALS